MRILIAEDEREMANAICAVLKHNNYSVDAVYNGTDALEWGRDRNYDGIILDIMMPGMSGLEVLARLRSEGIDTPIILLTAMGEIEDRIAGLDRGADDYLPKPFAMGELLARIRAMTRRRADYLPSILECGDIVLDRSLFELRCGSECCRLGNKEFQMLELMMSNSGRLISTEMFMEKIWGYDADAEINVVWVYISYLRKKLASVGSSMEIRATRGVGYMLADREGTANG